MWGEDLFRLYFEDMIAVIFIFVKLNHQSNLQNMKQIQLLTLALVLTTLFACEKNDNDIEERPILNDFEQLLDEYSLLDSDIDFEGGQIGVDTSLIFFNGRDEQKLHICAFDREEKKSIFKWTDNNQLPTEVTVANQKQTIDKFTLRTPYKHNSHYAFILQSNSNNLPIKNDLYFVSQQGLIKKSGELFNSGNLYYTDVMKWFDDNVLIRLESNSGVRKFECYNVMGEKIFETQAETSYSVNPNNIAISLHECIIYSGGVRGKFICKNIATNTDVWESKTPNPDLSLNSEIKKVEFTKENSTHIICHFVFKLVDDSILKRKIKVAIASGEIEEI